MHRLLTSIVLCLVAHTAAAQCVAAAPPATTVVEARQADGLIATAAAGTRDPSAIHKVSAHVHAPATGDQPRRTGPAMVLTAVAFMSAIALRRAGTSRQ